MNRWINELGQRQKRSRYAYFDLDDRVIWKLNSEQRISWELDHDRAGYSGIGTMSTRMSKEGGCHLTAFICDEALVVIVELL
jgi:hypothetical protein